MVDAHRTLLGTALCRVTVIADTVLFIDTIQRLPPPQLTAHDVLFLRRLASMQQDARDVARTADTVCVWQVITHSG